MGAEARIVSSIDNDSQKMDPGFNEFKGRRVLTQSLYMYFGLCVSSVHIFRDSSMSPQ